MDAALGADAQTNTQIRDVIYRRMMLACTAVGCLGLIATSLALPWVAIRDGSYQAGGVSGWAMLDTSVGPRAVDSAAGQAVLLMLLTVLPTAVAAFAVRGRVASLVAVAASLLSIVMVARLASRILSKDTGVISGTTGPGLWLCIVALSGLTIVWLIAAASPHAWPSTLPPAGPGDNQPASP